MPNTINSSTNQSSGSFSGNRPLAVVTGASSGIGYELAKQFAENGYDLFLTSQTNGVVETQQVCEQLGASVQTVQADLASFEGVHALYGAIKECGQPVEAIAINAGVGVGGRFAETSLEKELNLIALNVTSTVHLAKHIVRDMVARGTGKILFTSSIAATMPGPFEAVYSASKAFILSFSEALRTELADTNITVTALMPGPTDTNFFKRAGMLDTKVGAGKKDSAEAVAKDGFKALMNGDDHIIAGSIKNALQGNLMGKLLTESAKSAIHAKMSEPGSASK